MTIVCADPKFGDRRSQCLIRRTGYNGIEHGQAFRPLVNGERGEELSAASDAVHHDGADVILLLDDRLLVRSLPGRRDLADLGRHHRLLLRRQSRVVLRRVDGRGVRVSGLGLLHVAVVRARTELGRRTSRGYDPGRSRHERIEQVDRAAVVVGRERGEELPAASVHHDGADMVLLNRVVRRVRGELRDLDADPGVRIPLGRIWLVVNDCLPIRPAPVHVAIIRITAFVPIRLHHVDGNFSHGHRRVKAYPRTVLIRRHVGILEHRKRRNGIRLPDEPEHRVHPGQRGLSGRPRALTRSVARSCQIDVVVKRPPG